MVHSSKQKKNKKAVSYKTQATVESKIKIIFRGVINISFDTD